MAAGWSPLNAPFPYYTDAVQNGPAPYHYYQGSDNQAALMWALTNAATDPDREPFVIPRGYAMTGPLTLPAPNVEGLRIENERNGVLIPHDSCAGQNVLDLTGIANADINGLTIGRAAFNPAAKPFAVLALGIGPASGNEVHFDGLSLYGMCIAATLFNEGSVSSSMRNSQIHTYGTGHSMWHRGATSWKFDTVENHDSSMKWRQDVYPPGHPLYTGYGDNSPLRFDNCGDFKFDSGNIGGNSPRAVDFYGFNQKLTFDSVSMYAQDPAPKLANGQPGPGQAYNGLFKNYGEVQTLRVLGCRADADAFIYGAVSGAIYRDMRHEGYVGPFKPGNMVAVDAAATFEDIYMECSGLPVNAGGHLGGIIRRGVFRNVSAINAIKVGVDWQTPDGRWHHSPPNGSE